MKMNLWTLELNMSVNASSNYLKPCVVDVALLNVHTLWMLLTLSKERTSE